MSMSSSISACNAPVTAPVPPSAVSAVAVLRWPADSTVRTVLRAAGLPRLLIVDRATAGPSDADEWEDWIDAASPPADIELRRRTLAGRAVHSAAEALDIAAEVAQQLTLAQAAVLHVAVQHGGRPVHRRELVAAHHRAREAGTPRFATDLARLRVRLTRVGVELVGIGHGQLVLARARRPLHMPFTSNEHR
jgi:hypothetical protein